MGRTNDIMVTNDGATILKSLYVDNPAAKVLVGEPLLPTHSTEHGDRVLEHLTYTQCDSLLHLACTLCVKFKHRKDNATPLTQALA